MNLIGSTFIALADDGRLFGLDYQLLLDAAITAFNVFILFVLLSYILFNPVRNMLKKRQDKIAIEKVLKLISSKHRLLKLNTKKSLNKLIRKLRQY